MYICIHTYIHAYIHIIYTPGFEATADNRVGDHFQVNGQQTSKHLVPFEEPVHMMSDKQFIKSYTVYVTC